MKKKKYTRIEVIAIVFCFCGCALMVLPKFIAFESDMFPTALTLNGIGLAAFLYSQSQKKI